jgi:hypothetical protein
MQTVSPKSDGGLKHRADHRSPGRIGPISQNQGEAERVLKRVASPNRPIEESRDDEDRAAEENRERR